MGKYRMINHFCYYHLFLSLLLSLSTANHALLCLIFSGSEWVNPEDPNVIAENELLGAAAAIEAAARKLAELKPKPRPKVEQHRFVSCDVLKRFMANFSIQHF